MLEAGGGIGMYAAQMSQRYGATVALFDIEPGRALQARSATPQAIVAAAEQLPYASERFDTVLSNEVLEHVQDDRLALQEMLRVLKPGGRAVIFCPNRWYPFETHGHYWRGNYHFGNTMLINWLPDALRDRLAPHVRAYTRRSLLGLTQGCPARVVEMRRIYGGYDNLGRAFRSTGASIARAAAGHGGRSAGSVGPVASAGAGEAPRKVRAVRSQSIGYSSTQTGKCPSATMLLQLARSPSVRMAASAMTSAPALPMIRRRPCSVLPVEITSSQQDDAASPHQRPVAFVQIERLRFPGSDAQGLCGQRLPHVGLVRLAQHHIGQLHLH